MLNPCSALLAQYMYKDRCTIARQVETTDEIGADVYEMKDIYTNVPCKLGQTGQSSMNGLSTDRAFMIQDHLRLSLPVEYDVKENDIITIQHKGQTFVMRSDTPFKYMSHQEISLFKVSEA